MNSDVWHIKIQQRKFLLKRRWLLLTVNLEMSAQQAHCSGGAGWLL